jgi:hypothetical protein
MKEVPQCISKPSDQAARETCLKKKGVIDGITISTYDFIKKNQKLCE